MPAAPGRTGPNLFKYALISAQNAFLSVLLLFFSKKRHSVNAGQGADLAPRRELSPSNVWDMSHAKIPEIRAETVAEHQKRMFSNRKDPDKSTR